MKDKNKSIDHYSKVKIKKGLLHFLTGTAITAVASFSVAILIVRELSISQYASYTALSGLLIVIMLISNLGIERILPRFIPKVRQYGSAQELLAITRWLVVCRALSLFFFSGVLYLISDFISAWLNVEFSQEMLVYFLLYMLGFGLSSHFFRNLQVLMKQKEATISMGLEWFIKLIGLVFIISQYGGISLEEVFLIQAITVWIGVFASFYFLYQVTWLDGKKQSQQNVLDIKEIVQFGAYNYFQLLLGFHALPSTSKLVAATFFAGPALASLGFAYAMIGVVKRYMPAKMLLRLIEPAVMVRYDDKKDFDKTCSIVLLLLKLNLFIILPLAVWFYFCSEPLINLITKDKYSDSVWIISALLLLMVLESQRDVLQLICNAVGHSVLLFKSNIYSLLLFPLWLYLTFKYELPGLIFGLILILFFRNIYLTYQLARRGFKFHPDYNAIFVIFIWSMVAVLLASQISSIYFEGYVMAFISAFLFLIFYLSLCYIKKPFLQSERTMLNGFIGKRIFIW